MLKNPVTRTDCFRIVFAKILRKDIRLESGGCRKLNEIEQDLSDFWATDQGLLVKADIIAKKKTDKNYGKETHNLADRL